MKDYYNILELKYPADELIVKRAFRRLALKYHPDKNNEPNAVQKFIELTEAYEVLRDQFKKYEYDRLYHKFYNFKNENQNSIQSDENSNIGKEWAEFGKEKANEYVTMSYEEFTKRLINEINVGASYFPNVIAILSVTSGAIGILTILPEVFEDSSGLGIFLLFLVLGLGYLAWILFNIAKADYKEERRRKIIITKK